MGAGGYRITLYLPLIFAKTIPRNKFYFLKSTLKTIQAYYMVYPDNGIVCVCVCVCVSHSAMSDCL